MITDKAVTDKDKANASLVKGLMPGFRPSYTLLRNKSRLYSLIPENIQLVKYGDEDSKKDTNSNTGGSNSGSGSTENPGGSGSEEVEM